MQRVKLNRPAVMPCALLDAAADARSSTSMISGEPPGVNVEPPGCSRERQNTPRFSRPPGAPTGPSTREPHMANSWARGGSDRAKWYHLTEHLPSAVNVAIHSCKAYMQGSVVRNRSFAGWERERAVS